MFEGLWGEAEVRERLTIIQQRGQELFCDLIHAGLKDGSVRPDVNVEAISLMASTALRGATYQWLLEEDFDICAAVSSFGDVLESLLRPPA